MMYDEHPNYVKNEYWKTIAIHDDDNVRGFFGPYRFLSNFELATVEYEGILFPSVENAYQAAKVLFEHRHIFQCVSAYQSKKIWNQFELVDKSSEEWDKRKLKVMEICLRQKFYSGTDYAYKLIATGDKYLSEYNWWGDLFYGFDVNLNKGRNELGKLLMKIRNELK